MRDIKQFFVYVIWEGETVNNLAYVVPALLEVAMFNNNKNDKLKQP